MASFDYFICENNGTCADCQCGKVWFTRHDEDYEALLQKAAADKDQYRESDDDGLAFGWLSGRQVVFGCDCGFSQRHEDWIREHEKEIRQFLRQLGAERLADAEELAATL